MTDAPNADDKAIVPMIQDSSIAALVTGTLFSQTPEQIGKSRLVVAVQLAHIKEFDQRVPGNIVRAVIADLQRSGKITTYSDPSDLSGIGVRLSPEEIAAYEKIGGTTID
ncbi:hypothetical protein HYV80_00570 [Candidatus Woesearchaeota archaeon]|nr:hypothetical protein [Candidatus Woesearchaeota archaeon]